MIKFLIVISAIILIFRDKSNRKLNKEIDEALKEEDVIDLKRKLNDI